MNSWDYTALGSYLLGVGVLLTSWLVYLCETIDDHPKFDSGLDVRGG